MALFAGARVYLSRTLLPPGLIDSLHDLLKQHGALVHFCCDPSACSPSDFHVLFSVDSEKALSLQANRCQVLGPQCVFQCAEAHKPLPKKSCSCCLALEGTRIYVMGFGGEDLARIKLLVSNMCGILDTTISSSTDFIVAKALSSSNYQQARSLRKPVVSLNWLEQCYREHRIVPHEQHKLPLLSGLVICVTQVPLDARARIAEAVRGNGGSYSPDLRRECTHLIANTPDGQKYIVAKRWSTVKLVNQQWLWESLSLNLCLEEELFPVPPQANAGNDDDMLETVTNPPTPVLRFAMAQATPLAATHFSRVIEDNQEHDPVDTTLKPHTAADLYLADCRFYIVGFDAVEMARLVDIVLDGGGTRYMELNNTISHIVMGCAHENEFKRIQQAASWGAMQVVTSAWLDECAKEGREVSVTKQHIPAQILQVQGQPICHLQSRRAISLNVMVNTDKESPMTNKNEACYDAPSDAGEIYKDETKDVMPVLNNVAMDVKVNAGSVFSGAAFSILENIPLSERDEIVKCVRTGGGCLEDMPKKADYLIGGHGIPQFEPMNANAKVVSIHWVLQCLQELKLLDTNDHPIYRPLPCRIPLLGFENFRFCISQYEGTERSLCHLLSNVLGAKFTEVLKPSRVTHLLCKAGNGEKYEAAVRWGIRVATIDWLYACVTQNAVVPVEDYHPSCNGVALPSQCPSNAGPRASQFNGTSSAKRKTTGKQFSQTSRIRKRLAPCDPDFDAWDELTASWSSSDVALSVKGNSQIVSQKASQLPSKVETVTARLDEVEKNDQAKMTDSMEPIRPVEQSADGENEQTKQLNTKESNQTYGPVSPQPDVAAAIENLLAQTTKDKGEISLSREEEDEHDLLSEATAGSRGNLLPEPSKSRSFHEIEPKMPSNTSVINNVYEDSQFELSQVVAYDEDYSRRQVIMERVRSASITGNGLLKKRQEGGLSKGLGRLFEAAEAHR